MASLREIESAINICLEEGNQEIAVLHCVSSYPCPLEYINLKKIQKISTTFDVISGLSDHTIETETPILSSAWLIFAGFQCIAVASDDVATPTSPIAPDLESGDINKNGTAVVIVLRLPPSTSS